MRMTEMFVGGYYHIYNRGVDKRNVFETDADYMRFYASLAVFNDADYNDAQVRTFNEAVENVRNRVSDIKRLVDILSFCLVPNHFHLLIRQYREDGVAKFMQKIQLGYTKYFNLKNQRSGRLFQGPYQSVFVKYQAQLEHLPCYIHLNGPSISAFDWRDGETDLTHKLLNQMVAYKWSSHNQYLTGEQDLPVVFDQSVEEIFDSRQDYVNRLLDWSTRNCSKPGFEH